MIKRFQTYCLIVLAIALAPVAAIAGSTLVAPATISGALTTPIFSALGTSTGAAISARNSSSGNALVAAAVGTSISATSTRGAAVLAKTTNPSLTSNLHAAAVSAYDNSTDGGTLNYGVYGQSANGMGVTGVSKNNFGLEGLSTNSDGVYGYSESRYSAGVDAESVGLGTDAMGLYAGSLNGPAITAYAPSGHAMTAQSDLHGPTNNDEAISIFSISGGSIFRAWGGCGTPTCGPTTAPEVAHLDGRGNLTLRGQLITSGQPASVIAASDARPKIAYGTESTSPVVEDFGTVRIVNGAAQVHLNARYQSIIDSNAHYMVFLTPHGPSGALYVANETASSFTIAENGTRHSDIDVDYRIVAHPLIGDSSYLTDAARNPRVNELNSNRALKPRVRHIGEQSVDRS